MKALFKRDANMAGTLNNLPELGDSEGTDNRECSLSNMEHFLEVAKQLDDKVRHICYNCQPNNL